MRVVAEIPHSHFKITVFSWNGKFQLKVELDQYEQVYKINEADVDGIEDIKNMVTDAFLKQCFIRFLTMREDWSNAFKNKNQHG